MVKLKYFAYSSQVSSSFLLSLSGYISVKTTALAKDSFVSRMAKLVEESHNKKSRAQRFIDNCAKYYIPG